MAREQRPQRRIVARKTSTSTVYTSVPVDAEGKPEGLDEGGANDPPPTAEKARAQSAA